MPSHFKKLPLPWGVLLLLSALLINGCGGGGVLGIEPIEIVRAEVQPNPVPAPTADVPTPFTVQWQVKRDNGYQMIVQALHPSTSGYLIQDSCLDCGGQLVEVACTSSVSSTDSNARVLKCSSDDLVPTLPIGTFDWKFQAGILGSGIGLSGEHDIVSVPVELK